VGAGAGAGLERALPAESPPIKENPESAGVALLLAVVAAEDTVGESLT